MEVIVVSVIEINFQYEQILILFYDKVDIKVAKIWTYWMTVWNLTDCLWSYPQNLGKEMKRRELLTQPMRVQTAGLFDYVNSFI